jgi:4'-phosphopantetheinyl transferase
LRSVSVDLWTIPLTEPRPNLLSADEATRAARFHFEHHCIRWTRAHSALREILATYTGTSPGGLEFTVGQHGKPALRGSGVEFNLSHSGDYAMIAIATSVPVGVDIERVRDDIDIAALLRRMGEEGLPETMAELYARWTGREAKSKAAGGLLFTAPSADVCVVNVDAPEGYVASVAAPGLTPLISYRNQ